MAVVPSALAIRNTLRMLGLRTPRSIPLMYVGSRSAEAARCARE
jgi:hypothetical protein